MGPGQYTMVDESFPISVQGFSGLTIEGDPGGGTVIDASGADTRVMAINNVNNGVFRNLTFTGGYIYQASGGGEQRAGGVAVAASTVSFTDCVISNNYLRIQTALGGGLSIDAGSSVVMTRCQVVANSVVSNQGNWPSQGAGIYNAGSLVMRECELLDNNNAVPNTANQGGALYNTGSATLRNNLIARNEATTQGGGIHVAGGTLTLKNCTVVDNLSQGLTRAGGTVSATNTIFWGNTVDIVGTVTLGYCNVEDGTGDGENGNISLAPGFVDAPDGDYRLRSDSLMIDKGIFQDWMIGAVDLDGNARIRAGNLDLGCYASTGNPGTLLMFR